MWITFSAALIISLISGYFFFTANDRRSRVLEGFIALGSMMICLAVAPLVVKGLLLLGVFTLEQWRVRWEASQGN
jgi:Na+/H+-dicarboxylate symporter